MDCGSLDLPINDLVLASEHSLLRIKDVLWFGCAARWGIRGSFALIFGGHSEAFVGIRGHSRVMALGRPATAQLNLWLHVPGFGPISDSGGARGGP